MNEKKIRMLAQLTLLIIVVALVGAWALTRSGYKTPTQEPDGTPTTFTISEDGRTLNEELNGFALAVPERWVAIETDVPNLINLEPETANVACGIEIAHGKNVTGTSATGFLSYYDPGNRDIGRTKDNIYELRDIQSNESAYLAWTEERTSIRKREVYIPYQGHLLTVRYWESIEPGKVGQQPVPCVRTLDELLETGIQFP